MTTPGFHDDIPEPDYHADRGSLSVSGAKTLLKAPALYRWQQDHPVVKNTFDVGHAAHKKVLGVGAEVVIVQTADRKTGEVSDAENYNTKSAQEHRDAIRASGAVPLLAWEAAVVDDMAEVLDQHKLAMSLLCDGRPEVSAYCTDLETGIMRRCRYDYLRDDLGVDYKSCADSSPFGFARACASYGYHQQAPWYLDIAHDLGRPLRGFVFIAQMKEPPYLVGVYELEPSAIEVGRERNRRALERFRDCTETGVWPGFVRDDEITPIDIPRWAYYDNQEIA